jgi:hypothetical protein
LIVAALSLAVSGCAAFFSQVTDQVSVNSEPPGAECRVERMAQPLGVVKATPGTIALRRSAYPIDVFCTKDGEAGALTVYPGIDPITLLNVFSWGPTYLVDAVTDGDRALPDTVLVRFPVKTQ